MNVLIAEDDALINDGIADQLVRLGYTPAGQAYDQVQAVELACAKRPGVVLMDLQMIDPETGREDRQAGLKATRAIQERCPAPVVVLTAHASAELVQEASEAGVSGYLVKPANDQDLARMITIARARFADLLRWRGRAEEMGRLNEDMRATLAKTKTLRGLLSLCAWCSKVRDEEGLWLELEAYVRAHSEATFSHGVCPECYTKLSPRFRQDAIEY